MKPVKTVKPGKTSEHSLDSLDTLDSLDSLDLLISKDFKVSWNPVKQRALCYVHLESKISPLPNGPTAGILGPDLVHK